MCCVGSMVSYGDTEMNTVLPSEETSHPFLEKGRKEVWKCLMLTRLRKGKLSTSSFFFFSGAEHF